MNSNTSESEIKSENEELLQLVSFRIGSEEFGVDILQVQEINRMMEITDLPNSPDFIEGIINLRGKIISIIDLRKKLGMLSVERTNDTRIIVLEMHGSTVGFIVDEVNEVLRVPSKVIEPPPDMVGGIKSEYIKAVGKLETGLLILLDFDSLFLFENSRELEAV